MRNDVALLPSTRRCRRACRISSWCLGIAIGLLLPIITQAQTTTTACFAQMALADSDGSNDLDQTEYVKFVDSITSNAINATAFSDLPLGIQELFIQTACPNCRYGNSTCVCTKSVPIYGARPSDHASGRTIAKLAKFCHSVQSAVNAAIAVTNTTLSPSATLLNTSSDLTSAPAPLTTAPIPSTSAPAAPVGFVLPTTPASFPTVQLPTSGFLTQAPSATPRQQSSKVPTFGTPFTLTNIPSVATSNATSNKPSVATSNATSNKPSVATSNFTSSPTVAGTLSAVPTIFFSTPVAVGANNTLVPSVLKANKTWPPSNHVGGGTFVPTRTLVPTASGAPTILIGNTSAPSMPTQLPTLFVISNNSSSPNSLPTFTPAAFDTTAAPTLSSQQCTIALAYSDISRDSALDTTEYLRFLSRLNYVATSFSSLPQVLQTNFLTLAGSSSTIDITGTLPGTSPTTSQAANLQNICLKTSLAISQARSGRTSSPMASSASPGTSQPSSPAPATATSAPSSGSTSAPAASSSPPAGTTGPTIPISQCFTAMAFSDLNRDDYLDQDEYVRFLNKLSSDAYSSATFSTLPTGLVSNFNTLATTNGKIYVYGARPGESADSTQASFLSQVCTDTQQAIAQAQGGSPSSAPNSSVPAASPSVAPAGSSSPPAASPSLSPNKSSSALPTALTNGPVPVISAFSISNTASLAAADLATGLNRAGLQKAYKLLVGKVVANLSATMGRRTLWMRHSRQLTVSFQNDSATTDRIKDTKCPSSAVAGSQCQNVIAHFIIVLANEQNVPSIQQKYANATQAAIAAGQLASSLKTADPQSALSVVGAIPIPIDALSPTSAPSAAPGVINNNNNINNGGGSSGGSSTGAIIGGVFAGLAGLLVIIWLARRRSRAPSHPSKDDKFASAPKFDDIIEAQKPVDSSENDNDFPDLEDSPVGRKESPDPMVDSPKAQEQPPDRSNPSMFGGLFRKKSDVTASKNIDEGDDKNDGGVVDTAPSSPPDSRRGFGLFGGQKSLRKKDEDDDAFGDKDDVVDEMEEASDNDEAEAETKKGGFNVFGIGKKRHSDPGVVENSNSGGFGEQSVDFSEYSFDEPTVMQEQQQQQQVTQRHSAPPTFKDATSSSGWSTGDESPSSQDSFFESAEWAGAQGQGGPNQSDLKTPKAGSKGFANEDEEVDFDDDDEDEADDEEDEDDDDEEEDEDDEEEEEEEEEEESYTDGDSTYQSNGMRDEATFDGTVHSDYDRQLQEALQKEQLAKAQVGEPLSDDLRRRSTELDRMVEMEDWEGVAAAANHFPSSHERFSDDEESAEEEDDDEDDDEAEFENDQEDFDEEDDDEEEDEEDEEEDEESNVVGGSNYDHSEGSGDESYVSESGSGAEDSASADPDESQRRLEYREEVESLVRMVVPDEIDNVDVMMTQFRGREAELVATLRTMQERSVTQRARAAVHRTKGGGSSRSSDASSFSASPSASGGVSNRGRSAAGNNRQQGAFDEESEDTPNGW